MSFNNGFRRGVKQFAKKSRQQASALMSPLYSSKRIDFLIVGAQKAGTTSLFDMLNQHPKLAGSLEKELSFFNVDAKFDRGLSWYHSNFEFYKSLFDQKLYFEATPQYMVFKQTLQRIKEYNPDVRLVVVLREPASRAFSAWTMYSHHFRTGKNGHLHDNRGFIEAIEQEIACIEAGKPYLHPGYVYRGLYCRQLAMLFDIFGCSQVYVTEADALRREPDKVLSELYSFLAVPYHKVKMVETHQSRGVDKAKYKEGVETLRSYFKPHNDMLFDLLGCEYDW